MYLDDVIAIHSRLTNVPKELRATAHTYGPPVVMVTCKTVREAELVAQWIRHAREDMCTLLAELGERKEAEQLAMDFTGAMAELREAVGGAFDGVDADAYVRELRGD